MGGSACAPRCDEVASPVMVRRRTLGRLVPIAIIACGGDGDHGSGPERETSPRVQFEMAPRGSSLPVPPGPPMFLFDSVPVPSSLTVPLDLSGIKLTTAGEVDTTPGPTINWTIESGGGSLASSSTEPNQ